MFARCSQMWDPAQRRESIPKAFDSPREIHRPACCGCILSRAMRTQALTAAFLIALSTAVFAQQPTAKPEDTEVWTPEPKVVTPGTTCTAAPSDAIILFDGKNLDEWVSAQDRNAPAKWIDRKSVV